jgi:hypothetical protein
LAATFPPTRNGLTSRLVMRELVTPRFVMLEKPHEY